MTKGETVTKPIELGLKKTDLQKQPKSDNNNKAPGQGRSGTLEHPAAHVTAIPPRGRKAKPEIVEQIGQQLIRVYKDVVDQPVPDRFLELLNALETGTPPEKTARDTEAAPRAKKAPK